MFCIIYSVLYWYESGISEEKLAELSIQLESNIIALPGQGGLAGSGGVGGAGGAPGSTDWLSSMRGQGGAGMPGNLGAAGEAGQEGNLVTELKAAEVVRPPRRLSENSIFRKMRILTY